jgi:hypothetical protein
MVDSLAYQGSMPGSIINSASSISVHHSRRVFSAFFSIQRSPLCFLSLMPQIPLQPFKDSMDFCPNIVMVKASVCKGVTIDDSPQQERKLKQRGDDGVQMRRYAKKKCEDHCEGPEEIAEMRVFCRSETGLVQHAMPIERSSD